MHPSRSQGRAFRVTVMVLVVASTALSSGRGRAATERYRFEDAYDNVNGGDWYRDYNNESATLAWGESYVMMSLAAMYRRTGDPIYLERLSFHADGVLAQTDAARGVQDYHGESNMCWQDKHYQPNEEPYCYVVHPGMIGYPIGEFARIVRDTPQLFDQPAWDGTPFGQKASDYVSALEAVIATHDDEFMPIGDGGAYAFQDDATFTCCPGEPVPLNQSNAMGRLLLVMWDLTGKTEYLDKATRLARTFKDALTLGPQGEYLWNYWGGNYNPPGEDISHAAINVGFAQLAASLRLVFDDTDMERFGRTFMERVYVDAETFSDYVGGGSTNGASYKPQSARWLVLAPTRPGVYQAVRDYYDRAFPPETVGSGSILLGLAYLARFEPWLCEPFFYSVDWAAYEGYYQATAYGANVLTVPPSVTDSCLMPLTFDASKVTSVSQWDGESYHQAAVWPASSGWDTRFVAFDPEWWFAYWEGGALFEFEDDFVEGEGIKVAEPDVLSPPSIVSAPIVEAEVGVPYAYDADGLPVAEGDEPFCWSLASAPPGARIDFRTGAIDWTPEQDGTYQFDLEVENDSGRAVQSFVVTVGSGGGGCNEPENTRGISVAPGAGVVLWLLVRRRRRRLRV